MKNKEKLLLISRRYKRETLAIPEIENLSKENPYLIKNIEVTTAHFGKLDGTDHYYKIETEKDFNLFMNILVPKKKNENEIKTKVFFEFLDKDFKIIELKDYNIGFQKDFKWVKFYENRSNKWYWVGPPGEKKDFKDIIKNYPKGTYYIRVFNDDKKGNYCLSTGINDAKFSFSDLFRLGILFSRISDYWE